MVDIVNEIKQRKQSAKQRGLKFSLMPLTLLSLKTKQRCYYLNIPLNVKNDRYKGLTKLTLDRKDPNLGYTKDNVVACSNVANRLKNLIESGLITPDDVIECGKKFKKELIK